MSGQAQMCPTEKDGKPVLDFRVTFLRDLAPDPKSHPEFSVKFVRGSNPPKTVQAPGTYDATGEAWLVCVAQEEFAGDVGILVNWTTGPKTPTPGRQRNMSHWFRLGTQPNHRRVRVVLPRKPQTIAVVLDGTPHSDADILRHYAATMEHRKDVDGVESITAAADALSVKTQAARYLETFRKAVERSGVGGTLVLAAGHGTHANRAFHDVRHGNDPFVHFDLVAAADLQVDPEIFDPAIVAHDEHWAHFINEDGSFKPLPPFTDLKVVRAARRRNYVRDLLRQMRIALWNAYAKEVIIAACGVGADPDFVQALADSLGTRVRTTSHWLLVSLGHAQHSNPTTATPPILYRLDTERPIDTSDWNPLRGRNPVEVGSGLAFGGEVVRDPTGGATTTP